MSRFLVSACFLLPAACLQAQGRPAKPKESAALPVKRVVLFKSGIGYFEHLGPVQDTQDVTIALSSGQLDDVLKSLTVLDLGGGRIRAVTYGSGAPAGRRLGELRLPVNEKTTLTEFLGALRGARLEVRSGTALVTGRLLGIERKTRISGGTTLEVDHLSLITDSGEVRTAELSPSFSVRILDHRLTAEVGRYMDLLSSAREDDLRRLVVSATGTGNRSLFVSYVSEVPVWKTTYRIVLSSKPEQKPLLQGWAIVDNTLGEDWQQVQLSLVAGAPQSFIQKLSQPYFLRRPVVPLPDNVSAEPQTHQRTLFAGSGRLTGRVTDSAGALVAGAAVQAFDEHGNQVARAMTTPMGAFDLANLPEGGIRLEVELAGFRKSIVSWIRISSGSHVQQDVRLEVGNISQAVEVRADPSSLQTESSSQSADPRRLGSGRALGGGSNRKFAPAPPPPPAPMDRSDITAARIRSEAATRTQELGDLFEYRLKEPITINKNQSALVPIVQSPVIVEKVSLWNESSGSSRPQRALWLTNTSGATLDGGSFTVIEEETFSGEGLFDLIKPGEKRLMSYAADLALTPDSRRLSEQQRVTRVRLNRGVMIVEREVRERKTYTFRNEDSANRTVIVEHPARPRYQLRSEAQPVESTAGWLRFRLDVKPKETASLPVEEARPAETTYALTNLSSDMIASFSSQGTINPAIETELRRIVKQKEAVAGLEARKRSLEAEQEEIYEDQARLRENIKSLKGSAEEKALLLRYTQRLDQQESRLEKLREEIERSDKEVIEAKSVLDWLVAEMSLDVRM